MTTNEGQATDPLDPRDVKFERMSTGFRALSLFAMPVAADDDTPPHFLLAFDAEGDGSNDLLLHAEVSAEWIERAGLIEVMKLFAASGMKSALQMLGGKLPKPPDITALRIKASFRPGRGWVSSHCGSVALVETVRCAIDDEWARGDDGLLAGTAESLAQLIAHAAAQSSKADSARATVARVEHSNEYLAELVADRLHRLCCERRARDGTLILSNANLGVYMRREARDLVEMLVAHGRVRERADTARERRVLVGSIIMATHRLSEVQDPSCLPMTNEQLFREALEQTDRWLAHIESAPRAGGAS